MTNPKTITFKQVSSMAALADLARTNAMKSQAAASSAGAAIAAAPSAAAAAQAGAAKVVLDRVAVQAQASAVQFAASQRKAQSVLDTRLGKVRTRGWILFTAAVVAMFALAAWPPANNAHYLFLWEGALMLAALAGIGMAINQRLFGAAIDVRNRVSLSKLQMLLWTTLAVAALTTLGSYWLHVDDARSRAQVAALQSPVPAPKAAEPGKTPAPQKPPILPGGLLLAMGISAASFVATPLLLSLKSDEQPTNKAIDAVQADRGVASPDNGKVDSREDPSQASFSDIFHGDEVGNTLSIDISKVQQIAVSLLLLGLYSGSVFTALQVAGGVISGLPEMNDDFVKLLAISHASYLAYKAAPKTATAPT